MSGAAWLEASPFPFVAPSIEASNPIISFLRSYVRFSGRRMCEVARRTMQKYRTRLHSGQGKNRRKDGLARASLETPLRQSFERLRGAVEPLRRGIAVSNAFVRPAP